MYAELVFLNLAGSTGHVVQSRAFGARNIDALIFMLRWALRGLHKIAVGDVMLNWSFCIRWELHVT
jgi:hypothetical protein